jgi:putative ABC transport system permease protein
MIRNHLKTAIRNIVKQKFYFLINILSLSIGMTSSLIILAYVWQELSYDKFHKGAENIYRVNLELHWAGKDTQQSTTPPPLARALESEFPEVVAATHIYKFDEIIVRHEDSFFAERALAVDSNFFKVFDFELIEGRPLDVLRMPRTLVITEESAKRYFGDKSPVGETLMIGTRKTPYEITGVVKHLPSNSHFHFTMLTSINSLDFVKEEKDNWSWPSLSTYVRLKDGASGADLEAKLPDMCVRVMGQPLVDWKKNGGGYKLFLQGITDIHLFSRTLLSHLGPTEDIEHIYILSAIAIFIIIIASINFMNLSTAKSAHRGKEAAIRKVAGSSRRSLVTQFFVEAILLAFLALFVAIILVVLLQTPLENMLEKEINVMGAIQDAKLILLILLMTLTIGIFSGMYPALYLTSFQTVDILKGKLTSGMNAKNIRNSLVIFQFAVSIGFIICTSLVYNQLQHMRDQKIGFDRENVLIVYNTNNRLGQNRQAFKEALQRQTNVESVAYTNSFPGKEHRYCSLTPEGASQDILFKSSYSDYDYLSTLRIGLTNGRSFSKEMTTNMATDDEASVVMLNESAVKQLKFNPVDTYLQLRSGEWTFKFNVVGIVKDFNFQSLKAKVEPMVLFLAPNASEFILVKYKPGDTQEALRTIRDNWSQFAPDTPFDYSFLDQYFDQVYKEEQRLGKIFSIFAGLAVIVACLGLFGLATFTAEQRSKEIGIRKVLGASEYSIILLLTRNFMKLVVIAFIITVPLVYNHIKSLLEIFA